MIGVGAVAEHRLPSLVFVGGNLLSGSTLLDVRVARKPVTGKGAGSAGVKGSKGTGGGRGYESWQDSNRYDSQKESAVEKHDGGKGDGGTGGKVGRNKG